MVAHACRWRDHPIIGSLPRSAFRDYEQCTGLPLHYLFDAIPVGVKD
jgi:hypothetical protein